MAVINKCAIDFKAAVAASLPQSVAPALDSCPGNRLIKVGYLRKVLGLTSVVRKPHRRLIRRTNYCIFPSNSWSEHYRSWQI